MTDSRRIDWGDLSVVRFGDGSLAISVGRHALHLRSDEALQLASIMERLFRNYSLETP